MFALVQQLRRSVAAVTSQFGVATASTKFLLSMLLLRTHCFQLVLLLLLQAHWHGKVLLDHELNVVVAPLKNQPARAPAADAGVGDLDDGDFKLNTQVGQQPQL
jgi:hypothetical protein